MDRLWRAARRTGPSPADGVSCTKEVSDGPFPGSSDDHERRVGEAARRLQPPLAVRPLPSARSGQGPPATGPGSAIRSTARRRTCRSAILVVSVVLDLIGQPTAADIALVLTILTMLLAALSGAADYVEHGRHRPHPSHAPRHAHGRRPGRCDRLARSCAPPLRRVPIGRSRSSSRSSGCCSSRPGRSSAVTSSMPSATWSAGTPSAAPGRSGSGSTRVRSTDLAALPEATPTKMKAGINDLVVVRLGDTDPRAACRVRPRRRTVGEGHGHARRLPAVPVARRPLPAERRGAATRPVRLRPAGLRGPRRRGRRLRGPARRVVGRERPGPGLGVVDDRRRIVDADPARRGGLLVRASSPRGRGSGALGTAASSGTQRRT